MSIARWPAKNAKVRKDLNILRAVPGLLIKVLTDLEKLRDALFYRHLGPHGPKEVPALPSAPPHPNGSHPAHPANPVHPASDNRKTRHHHQTRGASRMFGATSEKQTLLQVWQPCMFIAYAVRVSPL